MTTVDDILRDHRHESYQLVVDNARTYTFDTAQTESLNIVQEGDGSYHLLHGSKRYRIEVLAADHANKSLDLRINGNRHHVQASDTYDQLIQRMGLDKASDKSLSEVKAPMPGLVLQVAVEAGHVVQEGDTLFILEAMKMENVLKAEGEGTIATIEVAEGDAVEKGQLLIRFE